MEGENFADALFTDDEVAAILPNDKNVELYAKVASVTAPIVVGTVKKYEVMKFMISNNKNKHIQCAAWDRAIPIHRPQLMAGSLIHMNGAWASEAEPKYNKGSYPIELTVKESTSIEVLQGYVEDEERMEAVSTQIDNLGNYVDQFVEFPGYIKTPFQVISSRGSASYGGSTICKGVRAPDGDTCDRVEIRVIQYVQNDQLEVGVKVNVKGTLKEETDKYRNVKLYLEISGMEDIQIIPGERKRSIDLVKCVKVAKRTRAE